MAELKTQKNKASVAKFLDGIEEEDKRRDCKALAKMMQEITGDRPSMWGESIVGFGRYAYTYDSGREGEWFVTGFSPRKQALTLYLMTGFAGHEKLLAKLGKHKTGRACLYVKSLDDVDTKVLRQLVERSVEHAHKTRP